jgi:hypothetical protein
MKVKFGGALKVVSLVPLKAKLPIVCRVVGNSIELKCVRSKAEAPMDIRFCGS